MGKNGSKKIIPIMITIIVIAVLIVGGYFIFVKNGNVRNKLITKENYNQITEQITEQLKDSDDSYYFIYACITYMSKAGLTEEYLNSQDESLLYKEIYNKTVNQLVQEGKKMLEESDMTLEKFKRQVDIINDMGNGGMTDDFIDENQINAYVNELEANNEI